MSTSGMNAMEDLYREIILDHYRNPRNRGQLPVPPAHKVVGYNPLCGDEVTVYLEEKEGLLDIRIEGRGCSISQSSASLMSQAVKGKTPQQVRDLIKRFKAMMSIHKEELGGDEGEEEEEIPQADSLSFDELGELSALRGVVKFPVRIKCATLAWNTLSQGLDEIEQEGHSSSG